MADSEAVKWFTDKESRLEAVKTAVMLAMAVSTPDEIRWVVEMGIADAVQEA
jgi:hypothetical protein